MLSILRLCKFVKKNESMKASEMLLENESQFSFEETVNKLTDEISGKGWKLIAIHDLQQTLKNNGKDVIPVKVFALCHPKHSGKILELDNERIVSSLMPCRISVYEKSNGNTYISRLNSGLMAASFGGVIEQVMKDSTADVEEIVKHLIINTDNELLLSETE